MTRSVARVALPTVRTTPVLAVLVCHDGEDWLPATLAALRRSTLVPRHVVAVDTGSGDGTRELLAGAAAEGPDRVLDGVLTLGRQTGFGEAVAAGLAHGVRRWGDPGSWLWLLHDDSAPEPDCLATMLTAADVSPGAGVLGPLALDWSDPRLVVEVGLSTDASGHRQTGIRPGELDWTRLGADRNGDGDRFEQSTEVLAVSSAGMLVRRELWEHLDGFDAALPLLRDDIDFGWRANLAGSIVLCVPAARIRHVRAAGREFRGVDAGQHPHTTASPPAMDRAAGLRTFLVNSSALSLLIGLPRLVVLCLLRAFGFTMQRRMRHAAAELSAVRYLLSGRANLRAARRRRRKIAPTGSVRGLFTSRFTRLRNLVHRTAVTLVRRRVVADAALGRLPAQSTPRTPRTRNGAGRRPVGPDALPAGALPNRRSVRRFAGLRLPTDQVGVVVPAPEEDGAQPRPSPRPRPSPGPRTEPDLVFVDVSRRTVVRQILLAPPVLLVIGLVLLAALINLGRFGDLAGGRLLPVGDLGQIWSEYLATWHPVAGGTAAPAPAALAVLGGLGAVFAPFGGPQAAIAVLLYAEIPLAGLSAYAATKSVPVRRWVRMLVAAAYAMLPAATAAVSQGRLDTIVVHILLPPVLAGIAALLVRVRQQRGSTVWLSTAAGSAFGLAVIGAFAPLVHLVLVLVALGGFVLVPGHRGDGRRRVAALFAIVLLPLALLLPWPAVVIQHPGVVLQGVGGAVAQQTASAGDLIGLAPGGPGAWPVLGVVVIVAVLIGLLVRPTRSALPGLGVAVLGVGALVLVRTVAATPLTGGPAQHGWAGPALLVIGWGLLWALLGMCRPTDAGLRRALVPHLRLVTRLAAGAGVAGLLALLVGVSVPGRTALPADQLELAPTLVKELGDAQRGVLILPSHGAPARQTAGRVPEFGDDDLAPTPTTPGRLAGLADRIGGGDRQAARTALADAAMSGVQFVVLPDAPTADRVRAVAADLVAQAPPATDGRPVLRLELAAGDAVLLSPQLARQAVIGQAPPSRLGVGGIVPVAAAPPEVAVRVSDGPDGRLLVIAAEAEPGWRATVNGNQVPIVPAWGHLVGVALPTRAADVRLTQPTALRSVLLLGQGAIVLFTLLTAIPSRRGRH